MLSLDIIRLIDMEETESEITYLTSRYVTTVRVEDRMYVSQLVLKWYANTGCSGGHAMNKYETNQLIG